MKYLLFSDLHGDKDGLVGLQNHPDFNDSKKVCLGDVVEFNDECVDYFNQVAGFTDIMLMGNHEAVLIDQCALDVFNPKVHEVIQKTKTQVQQHPDFLEKLKSLPMQATISGASLTHGSFNPTAPWTHVRYIEDLQQEEQYLPARVNFLAHGHIPFIAWKQDGLWQYERQIYDQTFSLDPQLTYVINTGSLLGSREMRAQEKTCLVFDDEAMTINFYKVNQND